MPQNTLVIMFDELVSYQLIPKHIRKLLPGYQAFRKIGIEFVNTMCNRQMCSPSRAVILTGNMDTAIQDNIDQSYQFPDKVNPNFPTFGKVCQCECID